jgi:hypothetical protein
MTMTVLYDDAAAPDSLYCTVPVLYIDDACFATTKITAMTVRYRAVPVFDDELAIAIYIIIG